MLTGRNEYLGARDFVAAVGLGFGPSPDLRQIGATLRFGQAHGAGPFTADQRRQIVRLLRLGPVLQDRVDAPQAQARIHVERPVGCAHHFRFEDTDRVRQTLAAVLRRVGKTLPAPFDKLLVGFLEAGGSGDVTVTKVTAFLVARKVQRGESFLAQGSGAFEDRRHDVRRRLAAVGQLGIVRRVIQHLIQQEVHIAQRSFISGHGVTFENRVLGHPPPVKRGEWCECLGQHAAWLAPRQRVGQDFPRTMNVGAFMATRPP